MKMLPRNPMRFDLFDLYTKYGLANRTSLHDKEMSNSFLSEVRSSIQRALTDERFLHGQRTQAMFEALVASLGKVLVLKQEDAGDVYLADQALKVPDFRLALPDNVQMLVEVKNVFQSGPELPSLKLRADALDGFVRYAAQMNCDLRVAVYWAQHNTWTLSSPTVFQQHGKQLVLPMTEALLANEMALLGDMLVGTKFPLRWRLYNDLSTAEPIEDDGADFTVRSIEMFCAERLITDPVEQNIAFQLMLFGNWHEEDEVSIVGDRVEWIEFRYQPQGDSGQPIAIIGSLSGMFSRAYGFATLDEEGVKQLRTGSEPGYWGRLIPPDYKGKALPIWRLTQKPSFIAAAGSWKDIDTEQLKADIYESRERASRPPVEL